MTQPSTVNASLPAGLILLAVSCLNMGYGLCMLVNDMEGAGVPLGIGAAMSALSTIFIVRGAPVKAPDAAPGDDAAL